MPNRLVLISGPISSGKTTLCKGLEDRLDAHSFRTKSVIREHYDGSDPTRENLQALGDLLDKKTGGKWVLDAISRFSKDLPLDSLLLVDSVRIEGQVKHIRRSHGPHVVHIHVTADHPKLKSRFKARKREADRHLSYDEAKQNETESRVDNLERIADIVFSTNRCTEEDVVVRAASHLGLYERAPARLVDVVVAGQCGSEGKGHVCSYLARE